MKGIQKKLRGIESRCLALVADDDQVVELVLPSQHAFELFVTGVQHFINESLHVMSKGSIQHRKQVMLRNLWAEVDVNADSRLDIQEIERLVVRLNFNIEPHHLKQQFTKFDKDQSGYIDF